VSALDPLNNVVAWVIIRLHTALGHLFGPNTGLAWGLSIVILVVAIRICLVPLFVKQVHAQRKMAQHAPHLQELRKKYKNDKQKLNEETMKFYKENGVNPLAGCLPMIPQMIVFFALFSVLRAIAEWKPGTALHYGLTTSVVESAQKATIFGVHLGDKLLFAHPGPSLHVAIVIAITVALSATTTFMTVRQTSKRGLNTANMDPDNPMAQSQKYMMYIVPFFSLTGLYWQYGLVLYWVTTNLWTLGQQYFMFRNWDVTPAGAASATAPATGTAVATQSSLRPRSAAPRTAAAKTAGTTAPKTAGTAARTAAATTRPARRDGRTSAEAAARIANAKAAAAAANGTAKTANGTAAAANGTAKTAKTANGTASSASTKAGPAARKSAAAAPPPAPAPAPEKRRLPRLGRQKPEPEPVAEVPTAKVVRQQPVRQAKSKRSGGKR
jgi:YidC/Oxa1 family membrane protein insertase